VLNLGFEEIAAWVGQFLFPLTRVGGLLMLAPVIGSRMVPTNIRLLMAVVLAVILMPVALQAGPMPQVDPFSLQIVPFLARELLIGVAMGLILQLVFAALVVAGEAIAMSMGLGFAAMIDPQGGMNVPVLSQFLTVVASLLFLELGGHLMLVQLLADSFLILPVSIEPLPAPLFQQFAGFGTQMFLAAIWVALPALTAILGVNIAMGVITRAAPQLNIFSIGFPTTLVVGFVILLVALPVFAEQFSQLLLAGFEQARAWLSGQAG